MGGGETLDADRRIVFASVSAVDGLARWVSLVTVELAPDGAGTRLDWTEQVTFLERSGDGSADRTCGAGSPCG